MGSRTELPLLWPNSLWVIGKCKQERKSKMNTLKPHLLQVNFLFPHLFLNGILIAFMLSSPSLMVNAQSKPIPKPGNNKPHSRKSNATDNVRLSEVLDPLRESIAKSEIQGCIGNLKLTNVKVALNTTTSKSGKAGINIWVVTVGGKIDKQRVSTQEFELSAINIPACQDQYSLSAKDKAAEVAAQVKDELAKIIDFAKIQTLPLLKEKTGATGVGFSPKKISISVKFAVKLTGIAGAKFQLLPIGVDISGEISKERSHTVTLTFESAK